jgi:hypothetical protein
LASFMKTLKLRFSSWYNKKHERQGTLWEARDKSVLVENGYAAGTMAAYILTSPFKDRVIQKIEVTAGKPVELVLQPFDVIVFDVAPQNVVKSVNGH